MDCLSSNIQPVEKDAMSRTLTNCVVYGALRKKDSVATDVLEQKAVEQHARIG